MRFSHQTGPNKKPATFTNSDTGTKRRVSPHRINKTKQIIKQVAIRTIIGMAISRIKEDITSSITGTVITATVDLIRVTSRILPFHRLIIKIATTQMTPITLTTIPTMPMLAKRGLTLRSCPSNLVQITTTREISTTDLSHQIT